MINISLLPDKIIRQPLFPLSNYNKIPKDSESLDQFIDSLFFNEKFSEAIYLSSPALHEEWGKIVNGEKNRGKINESILKYYLRATSNTVPFGLFTSYSVSSDTNDNEDYKRFSNIDMDYLLKLLNYLNEHPIVRKVSSFRKNNSIYKVGDKYRYIEPKYTNDNLNYMLSSIDDDELLDFLMSQQGDVISFERLKEIIVEMVEGVTTEEVEVYINQLIDSKIYISSLEVRLNEEGLLNQVIDFYKKNISVLEKEEKLKTTFESLIQVNKKMLELDEKVFNSKREYQNIFNELANIEVPFQNKYVINSNLRKKVSSGFEGEEMNTKLNRLLSCLSKISHSNIKHQTNLDLFKQSFYNRYEDQEVLLLEALDNELGIGYLSHLKEDVLFSDLIDDITISPMTKTTSDKKVEPKKHNFWMNLLIQNSKEKEVDLENLNLDLYKENNQLNSASFSLSYTYANNKVYLKHVGGTTGTNLIGRFSNNDKEVQKVINQVSDFEKLENKDKITAEIVHLPTNRAGNILIRKVNRGAEISLISKTSCGSKVIDANDLYISVKRNKIVLRSKKENKEVVPFLSSAQNFHYNSLPIYHFLCDLQVQDRLIDLSPNYGGFNIGDLEYCPRLIFGKDIVIRNAIWLLKKENYKNVNGLDEHLSKMKVPNFIYLTDGGEDKMIIDRTNPNILSVLFNELYKRKTVQITECVYDMNDNSQFANECISIVKSQKNKNLLENIVEFGKEEKTNVKRAFIYGDEWVYFKIYTGRVTSDNILRENISKIANVLLKNKVIDKWFFIRYTDPEFHLRVRFHLTDDRNYGEVSRVVNQELSRLVEESKIWKLDLSTYKRELERYHWSNIDNSETIFCIDSDFTIKMLESLKSQGENRIWLYTLKSIDDFFNAFNINLEERHKIIDRMFTSFWIEHGKLKSIKKDVNNKFRKYSDEITQLLNMPNEKLKPLYEERLERLINVNHSVEVKDNMTDLLWSYIHMHVNRFIQANPRFHELIMYGILERYYSKEKGKKKYNQKLVKNETY
jgi:thiopeptide-type bacteriocin biosynthesis protein